MKHITAILNIFTPLVNETKAAIDNITGIAKGVIIFVSVVLLSIYLCWGWL